MTSMKNRFECPYCKGTTILAGNTCVFCSGTGEYGLLTLPEGYYHSIDVVECIDFTEYTALPTPQSQILDLIVSAGFLDLIEGSCIRTKLLDLFPIGTTTNTNLSGLLGESL